VTSQPASAMLEQTIRLAVSISWSQSHNQRILPGPTDRMSRSGTNSALQPVRPFLHAPVALRARPGASSTSPERRTPDRLVASPAGFQSGAIHLTKCMAVSWHPSWSVRGARHAEGAWASALAAAGTTTSKPVRTARRR
jgi:hypothetical protein